jgi:hypothetical protein
MSQSNSYAIEEAMCLASYACQPFCSTVVVASTIVRGDCYCAGIIASDGCAPGNAYPHPTATCDCMGMFERLSSGYYVGQLYVMPTNGEHAFMEPEQHEQTNAEVYATGTGIDRLDRPLVMKLDTIHFPVFADDTVPKDTLELPAPVLADTEIENPPVLREVLLATAERAGQLLRWFTPYDLNTSVPVPP